MLRELLALGMKPRLIAPKMKRSIGAIQSRIFLFKKPRKPLTVRSGPDSVGAFYAEHRDNPEAIAMYLNKALATGDPVLATKAIGDMMRAQGMTKFAQKAGMRRDSLYRMFRGEQSATLNAAIAVLRALDMQLIAKPMASRGLKVKGKV